MMFDVIFNGSIKPKWYGQDDFPSCDEWKKEIDKWLLFIQSKGQLERYIPRLIKGSKAMRDEALAEMSSAYVLEVIYKYPVIQWEAKTANRRDIDFVIKKDTNEICCEVKSPGWEMELEQNERLEGRKDLPKYINAETRSIAPWQAIRHALRKAYPKFLPNHNNMVIIKDDLFVKILDSPSTNIDIALYEDTGLYGNERGYFVNNDFENIGGVLILDCRLINGRINYRHKFFPNKNTNEPFLLRIT